MSSSATGAGGASVETFTAILTTRPTGARDNEIDVSYHPTGTFTVRALRPADDAARAACAPTVRELGAPGGTTWRDPPPPEPRRECLG